MINYHAKASRLREKIIEMMMRADQGHPGSIFSLVEVVCVLYYSGLTTLSSGLERGYRDKIIVSKGHATHVVYPLLEEFGYIPRGSCDLYGTERHNEGPLRVFGNVGIGGIDCTTGSLGHGVGIGSGYALSDKRRGLSHKTFVIISEGEQYEGSVWEAALFAAHNQLDNLTVLLDRNRNIILGDTEACLRLDPVSDKWRAFGWSVSEVDGHDTEQICSELGRQRQDGRPRLIVCHTVKGKGNPVMENKPEWHYWHTDKKHYLL
jgi:transketolase